MIYKPITIATAQSFISNHPRENGIEIRKLMQKASNEGAKVIHFPEGAVSGYVKTQIKSWSEVDWNLLREELEAITKLASDLELWVVLGCNHRLTEPSRPHNSLYIISSEGKLHTRYDKQWCSHTEINDWYTPGNELCIFEVEGWRFGCALCIEIQFPELFLEYAKKNIDCVLFSAYSDSAMFGIQAQGYAVTNNFWFSVSIPTQLSRNLSSRMIGPDGEIQGRCESGVSDICLSLLDTYEPQWKEPLYLAKPWRKLAREGDIYRSSFVNDERSKKKSEF